MTETKTDTTSSTVPIALEDVVPAPEFNTEKFAGGKEGGHSIVKSIY